MQRPNILWISLEDTSPRFGCYGDTVARTPNIDRLAAGGCRFPNAFSTAGVCAPSRAAIITGMYQTAIGAHHMRTAHRNRHTPEMPTPYEVVPPAYVRPFPEYLRAAGYYCSNNSKTDYQFAPPLTTWDDCSDQGHWRNRAPGQPFFAVFNPTMTHESGMWLDHRDRELVTDPAAVIVPPYLPDTQRTRETIAQLYDKLELGDRVVGELLDQLEADGLADNTIVMLWSDHGAGLPRGKRWPYDAGINIPLIVRWPDHLQPGSVSDQLVSLVDLAPTVLSLTGTTLPRHFQGQPFIGPQAQPRTYIFAARDRHDEAYDMVRAARDRRFKYLRNFAPQNPYLLWIPYRNRHPILQEMWRLHLDDSLTGAQRLMLQTSRPPEELYDTAEDPWEINNLAADPGYAKTLLRMRAALDDWRASCGDLGDLPEAEMVQRMWPGGKQPETAPVIFIPICAASPGTDAAAGGDFAGPCALQLHCSTQGAAIAYTTSAVEPTAWQLYTEPLRLPAGTTTVRARAIRVGYRESGECRASFNIT